MKSLILIILIFIFTGLAYADWQVNGGYTVRTSKTVFTKQFQRLTEGIKPAKPLNGDYFKNQDGSILRWNGKVWEATTKTTISLTGRDKL